VFNMTWNDLIPLAGAGNDDFILETTSPDKDKKKGETTSEVIAQKFRIAETPETITLDGDSLEAVRAYISAQYTTTKGNGEWAMAITCAEAGDWWINSTYLDLDKGNDWQIEITAVYYRANIIEVG